MLLRTVIVQGLVSLMNDTASEIGFPLLSLLLTATPGAEAVTPALITSVVEAACC